MAYTGVSLIFPFPAAVPLLNHHRDLVDFNECPFSDDNHVVSSTRASDGSHSMKTSPSNQLPQATFGFPHPCQLGHAVPCYVSHLFSTMEQSLLLCLVTDFYAPYAPYAPFYASSMYYVCIPHGHFSYLWVCNVFELLFSFTDFIPFYKDLAYEIDLIFYWLIFFKALKLRFELEKLNNKFILDLERFQVRFSPKDFNLYFLNDFKMNLDFKSSSSPWNPG